MADQQSLIVAAGFLLAIYRTFPWKWGCLLSSASEVSSPWRHERGFDPMLCRSPGEPISGRGSSGSASTTTLGNLLLRRTPSETQISCRSGGPADLSKPNLLERFVSSEPKGRIQCANWHKGKRNLVLGQLSKHVTRSTRRPAIRTGLRGNNRQSRGWRFALRGPTVHS